MSERKFPVTLNPKGRAPFGCAKPEANPRGVARWFLPRPADGTASRQVRCPRDGASGDASCDSGLQPPSVSLHTLLAALAYQAVRYCM